MQRTLSVAAGVLAITLSLALDAHFARDGGQIPEPATATLLAIAGAAGRR